MVNNKLFLFDAMALIYRAFYAFQSTPRITSKGINTSASFGFTMYLYEIIKKEQPSHIAVCTDSQTPTFRHQQYEPYKANRAKMPEDIATNIPYIKEILRAMNIPLVEFAGYEADDIIGTIATKAGAEGYDVFMVTPDKDFGQLITDDIKIFKPAYGKNHAEILGVKEICGKFGLRYPKQMIDYLGLVGDSSDNIPGVPGVGPVAAKKLLDEYDNIENIIENADNIKNQSLRTKIKENITLATKSKFLATIITNVPCCNNIDDFIAQKPNPALLKKIFDELEFKTLAQRMSLIVPVNNPPENTINNQPEKSTISNQPDIQNTQFALFSEEEISANYDTINNTPHDYILINTDDGADNLVKILEKQNKFAFDTETTGINPNNCELVGFSISFEPHKSYFVLCPDSYEKTYQLINKFKPFFENPKILIIGQNIKFDLLLLKWYDIKANAQLFDTMIAHYLSNPDDSKRNMEHLSQLYLNYTPVPIENLIGKKGQNQGNMRWVEVEQLKEYAAEDADITYQLYLKLNKKIVETHNIDLFNKVEMPLVKVLTEMEFEGVKIDTEVLKAYSAELNKEIKVLEENVYDYAGELFNINSPKQLGYILFDKLKLVQKPKKTKTGQYQTGEDILLKLQFLHPIADTILTYRELSKLKSTYIDPLPLLINNRTGRIHTTYKQDVVATGRLSSNNPNLQNIPIRTDRGKEIRKAFIARNNNFVLLSADYSQIELRLIAAISQEQNMISAFREGKDIHTETASTIFCISATEVTPEMRRIAKTVNFGIIYGMSAFGLSERLNISRTRATDIIEQYFTSYPNIKKYMEETVRFAREHHYVETLLGRKRYLNNDISSSNANIRGNAERYAINAPIQGSSADMIKIAMINIENAIEEEHYTSKMILQVHDELVFDVHKNEVEKISNIVKQCMVNAMQLIVPVEVTIGVGNNWLEAH